MNSFFMTEIGESPEDLLFCSFTGGDEGRAEEDLKGNARQNFLWDWSNLTQDIGKRATIHIFESESDRPFAIE
jgi:hypothetical protein